MHKGHVASGTTPIVLRCLGIYVETNGMSIDLPKPSAASYPETGEHGFGLDPAPVSAFWLAYSLSVEASWREAFAASTPLNWT